MVDRGAAPRTRHTASCAAFWGWAAVGALASLSLDLGPLAALPALLLGLFVAVTSRRQRGSAFGVLTGAGLPLLWVAYVQRQGPGTTCWRTASSAGCDQHLDPLPWFVIGTVLVLAGLLAQRRYTPPRTAAGCPHEWRRR